MSHHCHRIANATALPIPLHCQCHFVATSSPYPCHPSAFCPPRIKTVLKPLLRRFIAPPMRYSIKISFQFATAPPFVCRCFATSSPLGFSHIFATPLTFVPLFHFLAIPPLRHHSPVTPPSRLYSVSRHHSTRSPESYFHRLESSRFFQHRSRGAVAPPSSAISSLRSIMIISLFSKRLPPLRLRLSLLLLLFPRHLHLLLLLIFLLLPLLLLIFRHQSRLFTPEEIHSAPRTSC